MRTQVSFQSNSFPYIEDECVNPHLYGKNLALFLVSKLPNFGYNVLDYYDEDVGWEIFLQNQAFPLYIRCGNQNGSDDIFVCVINPWTPYVRQGFRKIDTTETVEKLAETLDSILKSHDDIHNIDWED